MYCADSLHAKQVSFLVSFFFVEAAASQSSTALGFAVLEIPNDARLSDGEVAELSADVTSPSGKTLEDVVCVVDLKASGPAPRPARRKKSSIRDDDVSHHFFCQIWQRKIVTWALDKHKAD